MARRQTLSGITRVNNARLIGGGCRARQFRRLSALLRLGLQRIRDRGKPDYKRLSYFASFFVTSWPFFATNHHFLCYSRLIYIQSRCRPN